MVDDDEAERLAAVAIELVNRVRDEPAEANERWLHAVLPSQVDRERLLYVLAAAVPVDRPWGHLTRWATLTDVRALVAERFQVSRR